MKTNKAVVFSCRPFIKILKCREHWCNLPSIWKTRILQAYIKSSASMYENSGSQFFRTTTQIQSRPDAFDESRFVMTFLIIVGVTEILCSLVLEGKMHNQIPESSRLEFLENFKTNNFALSDNTSGQLNRGDIAGLPLLRTLWATHQKSQEPNFWEVIDSFVSLICKFDSFKNYFPTITTLSELYFRFRRFILLVHMKKRISTNYDSSTSCWKPWTWVRFDLILTMRDIYINSSWTNSQNLLATADALSLKNVPMENLSNNHKDCPNQYDNSHKLYNKSGHPAFSLIESQWKLTNNMIRIFQWKETHCRTNTSV